MFSIYISKTITPFFFAAAALVYHIPCIDVAVAALCGLLRCSLVTESFQPWQSNSQIWVEVPEVAQLCQRNRRHTRLDDEAEAHIHCVRAVIFFGIHSFNPFESNF